jgi:hypothetical protein
MPAPAPKTKGAHVLNAVKVLRSQRERALTLLPSHLHKYLEHRILPSSWYPLEEHIGLLQAVVKMMPAGPDVWFTMGRGTAQMDLAGIYRHFLRVGDPQLSLGSMGGLWRSAHDSGEVVITPDGPCAAIMTVRDFNLRSRDFCKLISGYLAEVATLAGGQQVQSSHSSCRAEGAATCIWRVTWQ